MNDTRFQEQVNEVLDMVHSELQDYKNVVIEYSPLVRALYSAADLHRAEDYLMSGFLHGIITGFRDFSDYYCLDNRILWACFDKERMSLFIGIDERATELWRERMDGLSA